MWTCNLRFWMRGWWSPGSSYWLVPEDQWAKASAWQHSWWLHCQQRNYHLGGHRWPSCGLSQDSQAHLPRRSHLSRECFFLCTLFPNVSRLSVDNPDWLPQGRQCIQRKEGHPRANFGTLHSYLPVLLSTSLSHHPVHLSADLLLRVSATRYIADPVTHRVRSRTCGLEAQKAIFSPLEAITTQKRNCWAEEITLLDSWWCLRNSWPETQKINLPQPVDSSKYMKNFSQQSYIFAVEDFPFQCCLFLSLLVQLLLKSCQLIFNCFQKLFLQS